MTGTVVSMGADAHRTVQALLPWHVRGSLDAADAAAVEAHLVGCAQCRAEFEWERDLAAATTAMPTDRAGGEAERGFAHLRKRVESSDSPGSVAHAGSVWRRRLSPAVWLHALLAVQFAAIVVLAAFIIGPRNPDAPYHTLGAASHAAAGNVVVRFRPEATERDIRQLLRQANARVVDGPTVSDAYLLDLPAAAQAAALTTLRAQPIVVLAESLDGGARP
jgi:Putative zinc-finger